MKAYEACLSATSTATAPWYVVPADDKSDRPVDRVPDRSGCVQRPEARISETEPASASRSCARSANCSPSRTSERGRYRGFSHPSGSSISDAASGGPQVFRSYSWTGVTSPRTGSTILHCASI